MYQDLIILKYVVFMNGLLFVVVVGLKGMR